MMNQRDNTVRETPKQKAQKSKKKKEISE